MIIRKFFDGPVALPPAAVSDAYKNVTERLIYVRATTDDVDRQGEVVVPGGVDFSSFMKVGGPVLLNHLAGQPCATCVDIQRVGNGIDAVFKFPDAGKILFADVVFAMVMEGLVGGVSVGFMPVETVPIDKGNPARGPKRYLKSDLLEISLTPTPCNKAARVLRTGIGAAGARKMTISRLKDAPEIERRLRELEVMKLKAAR